MGHPANSLNHPPNRKTSGYIRIMIESLTIDGYRKLKHFKINGLKQLNLLVGSNNSGKSSVLEALCILISRGSPESMWQMSEGRSEMLVEERASSRTRFMDVSHLFHMHNMQLGSEFLIESDGTGSSNRQLKVSVDEYSPTDTAPIPFDPEDAASSALALRIDGRPTPDLNLIPLSAKGGIIPPSLSYQRRLLRRTESREFVKDVPVQFVTTRSLDIRTLSTLWNSMMLTPDEDRVLTALRILEPAIERIALQSDGEPSYLTSRSRGGFIVRLKEHETPVPIGSMGEGVWRMLAIAIAISQCSGGVLLIDEVDTGLHYSVMTALWKMIIGASNELDVQVFATTHSYDCVRSLGRVSAADSSFTDNVSLHRIDASMPGPTTYNELELEVASENGIEVR